jgi:tyrosine decarboxylase / aspartate 1-decarboxylase
MWEKKTKETIKSIVFEALASNVNFNDNTILGVPASHLDKDVFSQDATFLKEAPFMSTLVQNPNNIGCHTLGSSESFFKGTQELEREVLEICAVDILKGTPKKYDGYIASGGTEANIQAIWIYRNYFEREFKASLDQITILCSEDSHYSMDKAANLLAISIHKVTVTKDTREITEAAITSAIKKAQEKGVQYFIVVNNMMTTMFGSVDPIERYSKVLKSLQVHYKIHVDGAYGGFYYPFTDKSSQLNFENPEISSFTLDAHKMAQAPYGTGIFLIRKGFIHYANTKEASYVEGEDYTLIGSRSGANAVAVWMILNTSGPFGWQEKIFILQKRSQWLIEQLIAKKCVYYRNEFSNIITIQSQHVKEETAKQFGLVPDNHHQPNWYKIVIMDHVTIEKLIPMVEQLV